MERIYEVGEVWIPQRADPYVYKHTNGKYYFTGSMPEYDGISLREADTLVGLKDAAEVEIWHKHSEGRMGNHIWAPELHFINNSWYIYFAGGDAEDKWRIRPYVLECKDENPITGTWTECGPLQCADDDDFSFRAFSLDTTVFENKGEWYCVWAEKVGVGKQISNLYIAKLETPTKLATVQVLLTTPDYDWERGDFWVNEGPFALHHEGKIFLTFSASDTGISYCVGMLEISEDADLLDPNQWNKRRYPVLKTNENLKVYGPGHSCFTEDENGNTILVFHARKETEIIGDPLYVANRHAMLLNVTFDENNAPVFDLTK